jgi:hypothetical protein
VLDLLTLDRPVFHGKIRQWNTGPPNVRGVVRKKPARRPVSNVGYGWGRPYQTDQVNHSSRFTRRADPAMTAVPQNIHLTMERVR